MKRLLTILFVLFLISIQSETVTAQNLFNKGWKFFRCDSLTSSVKEQFFSNAFDDTAWESVTIPHTPRIEPLVVNNQWQGDCLYRKTFQLPENDRGKILFIKFDAAMNAAEVWINGIKAGSHLGGYLPFSIDITECKDILWRYSHNFSSSKLPKLDNGFVTEITSFEMSFNTNYVAFA